MTYRGEIIEYDFLIGEFIVTFCGDEIIFDSVKEAKNFIDDIVIGR